MNDALVMSSGLMTSPTGAVVVGSGSTTPDTLSEGGSPQRELDSVQAPSDAITNFDLETLDEAEFDLPPVTTPTLQSILDGMQDDEDEPFEIDGSEFGGLARPDPRDAVYTNAHSDTTSVTTSSQEDILTGGADWVWRRKRARSSANKVHGSVARRTQLKGMSAQLASACERAKVGLPTAIATSQLLAVGTSNGFVLVFDPKQVLKQVLNYMNVLGNVGESFGGVTAMDFNMTVTRLIVGYARGQILMWDPNQGKLLRSILDAHPAGTAILHLKFTDDPTLAVFCDSGGSVFELEFKRSVIAKRTSESRCLFSGSRGEWVNVEPLHMSTPAGSNSSQIKSHPLKNFSIVALTKLNKVCIVTLKPKLCVVYSHPLQGEASFLPLLAWQLVLIQTSKQTKMMEPVLAFAKESTVYLVQAVSSTTASELKFCLLQTVTLQYDLLSLHWFNSRTLAMVDVHERLHIADAKSEEELEMLDCSDTQIVYGSSAFKSISTGGNVSQALAYAGERACYYSLTSYNGQLVMLGSKDISVYTLRNWLDRIDNLVKHKLWEEAFALASSFYRNEARAVVGLTGSTRSRQAMVSDKIIDLLLCFMETALTSLCPDRGGIDILVDHYQNIVPICVEHTIEIERTDFLYSEIYERLSPDSIAKGVFLEVLEPYILSDRLRSISPVVMRDLIQHYEARAMIQNIEACIVHVDVSSLDVHQVMTMCTTHGLYDAIFYVYNAGMNDFTSPMEELLSTLEGALESNNVDDKMILLGNKLLVYISCCLAGRAYPMGDIPDNLILKVKEDIFQFLVQTQRSTPPNPHSSPPTQPCFPYIRTFLLFDTREFLNVLTFAFEEPEFCQERRQRIVDILLQVMVESVGFSPGQIGLLFTFLARQMAKHEESVHVPETLFSQVFEFLCAVRGETGNNEDDSEAAANRQRIDEREEAVLELLHVSGFSMVDEDLLLEMARAARFAQVCELIYERKRQFHLILSLYWNDDHRHSRAIFYIEQVLGSSSYTEEEKQRVRTEALAHLKALIAIDGKRTAVLIMTSFPPDSVQEAVALLEEDQEDLYKFLKGYFHAREISYLEAQNETDQEISSEVFERYIELMCVMEARNVVAFLKATCESYSDKTVLDICKRHENVDAAAFLLEKAGRIMEAFHLHRDHLRDLLDNLDETLEESESAALQGCEETLTNVIEFAQRHSPSMNEKQREEVWFPLLEAVIKSRASHSFRPPADDAFKSLTCQVVNSMMSYVSPPAILSQIVNDASFAADSLDMKQLLISMLETFSYEKVLLSKTYNVLVQDLNDQWGQLAAVSSKGVSPLGTRCSLTGKAWTAVPEDESLIVFQCGHGYWTSALTSAGGHSSSSGSSWGFYKCFICRVSGDSEEETPDASKSGRTRRISSYVAIMPPARPPSQGASSGQPKDQDVFHPGAETETCPDSKGHLDAAQISAMNVWKSFYRTPARLQMLGGSEGASESNPFRDAKAKDENQKSIFHRDIYTLQLKPKPLSPSF